MKRYKAFFVELVSYGLAMSSTRDDSNSYSPTILWQNKTPCDSMKSKSALNIQVHYILESIRGVLLYAHSRLLDFSPGFCIKSVVGSNRTCTHAC
jgi:hypothetical protein